MPAKGGGARLGPSTSFSPFFIGAGRKMKEHAAFFVRPSDDKCTWLQPLATGRFAEMAA
jgi:hypothetical protein